MFDVATRSRHMIPNSVDHYLKEESDPGDAEGPESTIQSLSPYSLLPTPYSLKRSARSDLR
jgi:hypothetical protein